MTNSRSNANVPAGWSQQDRRFGESIKQNLDTLQGLRGDKLDRAVTFRDLIDAGLVRLGTGNNNFDGNASSVAVVNEFPDLLVPPAPTNLQASGAFQNIILSWDLSLYKGHSSVQVWRHTSDVIASATMVAQVSGFTGVYSDAVGSGQTFYYWVRAVNQNDITGPFNSSSGTQGQTAVDVDFLLTSLTDQITSSQLATDLSTPIGNLPADTNAAIASVNSILFDSNGNEIVSALNLSTMSSSLLDANGNARATSTQIDQLSAQYTNPTTGAANNVTLQQALETSASEVDGLRGQYSVKIDTNGHVAGFGFSSTLVNGTPSSAFIVNAEKFAIVSATDTSAPTNSPNTNNVPFIVHGGGTLNGVITPAGAYIKTAFIADASIVNAKIADAAIDNAKIAGLDAGKIDAGTISTSRLNIDGSTLTSVNGVLQLANLAVTNAKIANATIEEGKIKNLAVSTLKIQDQAVTFPNAITSSNTVTFAGTSSGTTFSTIQTLTGTYSGAPVLVSGTFAVRSHDDQALMRFRLRRGSTVLFTSSTKAVRPSPETVFVPFNFLDTSTSSGSRTYTLQAYVQDQYGYYSDRTIATLEVKK